jgi:hypothetical protein
MRRLWFWLPLLLWLAVEFYLLQGALSLSCVQPGGNRHEVFLVVFLWGLPSSILAAFLADAFWFNACSTVGCIAVWLVYCIVGFIQWYYVLRGLEWVATKLYQRLRSIGTGAAG